MPNYCQNELSIIGTKKNVKKFIKTYFTGDSLDFGKIIPEPKTEAECEPQYVIHNKEEAEKHFLLYDEDNDRRWFNWYDWRCAKWGTKWGAIETQCDKTLVDQFGDDEEFELMIYFDTAWAPAIPIIEKLIELNPELGIECIFYELGMCFAGKIAKDYFFETNSSKQEEFENFILENGICSEEDFEEMFGF